MFVDDLVIFSKAKTEQVSMVLQSLEEFCRIFGQKVNAQKSRIFFLRINLVKSKEKPAV